MLRGSRFGDGGFQSQNMQHCTENAITGFVYAPTGSGRVPRPVDMGRRAPFFRVAAVGLRCLRYKPFRNIVRGKVKYHTEYITQNLVGFSGMADVERDTWTEFS